MILKPLILCCACSLLLAAEEMILRIEAAKPLHQVGERFAGSNFCALWNATGASPAAVAATARLGLGTVRFPGGVPCQWWDWKEPLATGWTTITTDDAWRLASTGGAQLVLQTNTANTSEGVDKKTGQPYRFSAEPEHQADWLRWCREQKVAVAWWEIGNEPEMDAPKGIKGDDARVYTWYNAVYGKQVAALRAVDPTLRVAGPAATNEWFWWHQDNLGRFLAAHGDRAGSGLADLVSLHWYPEGNKGGWEEKRATAQRWQKAWEFIQATIAKHDTRPLPVVVSEWNWAGGQDNDSAAQYACALGNADIVGMFRRTGVWAHQHFCLQRVKRGWGVLGAGQDDARPESRPSPSFYALLLAGRLGRHVLAVSNPADEGHRLAAYAGRDDRGGVQLLLINKAGEEQSVRVEVAGAEVAAGTLLLMLPGEGGLSARTVSLGGVADPTADAPLPAGVPIDRAGGLVLPPYALALASWSGPANVVPAKAEERSRPAQPKPARKR